MTTLRRVAWLFVLAACQKASPAAPPPPQVTVVTVEPQEVPAKFEWVAQAEASKRVEVRAQVSGVIVARPYVEGTDVRKGTVLFRIDPRTYEANYQSARARLAQSRATLTSAERNLSRLEPLLVERAVAQKDVDDARTAVEQAHAEVQDAQAAVDAAKKSYEDTFVRAEISGRAGRALMVLGALASGPTDLLTTVEQVDPIYVFFSPSDQEVLRWRRDIAAKRLMVPPGVLDVQATLADGSVFAYTGKLNFVDLALQPATGALQLRAEFPQPPAHPPARPVHAGASARAQAQRGDPGAAARGAAGAQRSVRLPPGSGGHGFGPGRRRERVGRVAVADRKRPEGGGSGGRGRDAAVAAGRPVRATTYDPGTDTTLRARTDSAPVAPPSAPPPIRDKR